MGALQARLGTGCCYALAAWETEAWLFLFPDVLDGYADGWEVPSQLRGRDTGRFEDPKELLRRKVSTARRPYREDDAPGIVRRAMAQGLAHRGSGRNGSYRDFLDDIEQVSKALR
jgi:hypothetical protein